MKEKNIKLIMELIFIFILPLLILLPCVSIYNDYEYDSYGNYVSSNKIIKFDNIFEYGDSGYNIELLDYRIFRVSDRNDNPSIYDNVYITSNTLYLRLQDASNNIIYCPSFLVMYNGSYHINIATANPFPNGSTNLLIYDLPLTNSNFLVINNVVYYSVNSLLSDLLTIDTGSFGYGIYNLINIQYVPATIYTYSIYEYNDLSLLGKYKLLFTEYLNFNDSPILDLFISYNFLWLMMFISWHLMYAFLDFVIHLVKIRKRE